MIEAHAPHVPATNALPASPTTETVGPGHHPTPATRRVVLIDPRPERRAITRVLVDRSDVLTVVGVAVDRAEAESQIQAEQADVALVEIQMPVPEGLATIAALRGHFRDLCIIVCSFHDNAATRDAARAHGADGYLGKPIQIDELLRLINPSPRSPLGAPGNA